MTGRPARLATWQQTFGSPATSIDVRVDRACWTEVTDHIFDATRGEQAGALLVRTMGASNGIILVAERYLPVPDEYVLDRTFGLRYDARFNLRVAEAADRSGCGALLVHAHRTQTPPIPSPPDATYGAELLAFLRRRQPDQTHGLLVVGDTTVTGIAETRTARHGIRRVVAAGIPTLTLPHTPPPLAKTDPRDRQLLAIGSAGQAALAQATIAVIGISGGGSHVTQQLIHGGVGTLIPIDADIVDARNLRRVVTAVRADIDITKKVDLPARLAHAVRPEVQVLPTDTSFPSSDSLAQLRTADIIVGCVDGWDTRDALNDFALQHRIPYIDIGATIAPPTHDNGMRVGGQIALVTPDGPCLRCMGLVTDERVAASREQRRGYADHVNEPQVISINGTLASEAVTTALMLIAGDTRLAPYRRYAYPPGTLTVVTRPRQPNCPACQAARLIAN